MTTKEQKQKKTISNCYSITIRTGNGMNLGLNPVQEIINYFKEKNWYYILSLEYTDENPLGPTTHFQAGVFLATPSRQDNIRRDLLPHVVESYIQQEYYNGNECVTDKAIQNVKKHALVIKAHNSFDILINYCSKQNNVLYYNLPTKYYCDPHPEYLQSQCHKCPPLNEFTFIKLIK